MIIRFLLFKLANAFVDNFWPLFLFLPHTFSGKLLAVNIQFYYNMRNY